MVGCCEKCMWKVGDKTVCASIIEKEVYIDGEGFVRTYGMRLEFSGDGLEILELGDISSYKERVEELFELLVRGEVPPVHVLDVVEDFLAG